MILCHSCHIAFDSLSTAHVAAVRMLQWQPALLQHLEQGQLQLLPCRAALLGSETWFETWLMLRAWTLTALVRVSSHKLCSQSLPACCRCHWWADHAFHHQVLHIQAVQFPAEVAR